MSLVKKIVVNSEQYRRYRSTPKKVGLELNLCIILQDDASFCTSCVPYEIKHDWSRVLEGLPFRVKHYTDGAQTRWADCEKQHGNNASVLSSVTARFWLAAEDDKPSKTLSESAAMRKIVNQAQENQGKPWDERLSLEEIFSARIQAVLDDAQQQQKALHIAKQANSLIAYATKTAREQAKSNTDFDAKLAALKAEFEAEQEACLAAFIRDELADECAEDETDWHPRAIELATERADECLDPAIRSFMGRDRTCGKVKMADVFPEVTAEETAVSA